MYNEFDDIILRSLEEDAPFGDITTDVTVAGDATASGVFRAKESGVLCGIDIARRTFELVGGEVTFVKKKADGDLLEKGDIVAEISGNAASILMGERTALNLMQRASGIATATRRAMQAVEGTQARITDTRKTMPGLRKLSLPKSTDAEMRSLASSMFFTVIPVAYT